MSRIELGKFLTRLLTFNELDGFRLVFEPASMHRARRAKKSTALIVASSPETGRKVPGTQSVEGLIARIYKLAPETEAWVTELPRYVPRLYDLQGNFVKRDVFLSELRNREDDRKSRATEKSRRLLLKAIKQCGRELERVEIEALLKNLLKDWD